MNTTSNVKKGNNDGYVELINTTVGKRHLAVTAVKSRLFKTLKGAERFMNAEGYNRI